MSKHDINIKTFVKHYTDELDREYNNLVINLYSMASTETDPDACRMALQLAAGNLSRVIDDMRGYLNGYNNVICLAEDENEELRIKVAELKAVNDKLSDIIAEQSKKINDMQESSYDTVVKEASELLNYFKSRVEHIAKSEVYIKRTKLPKKMESSPKFEHAIDNNVLISQYRENGNSITREMLQYWQSRCSITYQGLRNRLMQLGVWVDRKEKKYEQTRSGVNK